MAEVETAQSQQADSSRQAGSARPREAEERAAGPLAEAISIMARLRAPGGCPWDREQNFDTIKRYTLEETYEVFDAIERRAWPELKDELGDLLLQVLFYAQMASEAGHFDIADVAANLNAKLVRRHPHVFPVDGRLADATDPEAVLRNWEQIKRGEKLAAAAEKKTAGASASSASVAASAMDAIPRSMPATMEARKLGSKAAKAGFDWPDVEGLFEKLQEEIAELIAELKKPVEAANPRVEEELGDLLFTAVNLARHLKVDAESALREANAKFRARFRAMEASAGGFDALASLTPAELDALWNRAKRGDEAVPDGPKP
ncbi:MAG: nucleoside triphosphate pyrophosphohydrolase [Acidobacteriaceae bacterium]|jgi:XTP/dITP diphosphohydrolase/ATP diphosphatase